MIESCINGTMPIKIAANRLFFSERYVKNELFHFSVSSEPIENYKYKPIENQSINVLIHYTIKNTINQIYFLQLKRFMQITDFQPSALCDVHK